jgi:hypothetical protein
VDGLVAQKDDFEKDSNKLPPSLGKNGASFAKRIKAARADLDKAYGQAIRDYTTAGKDAQASAIKSEREEFRSKTAANLPYRRETDGPIDPSDTTVPVPPHLRIDPNLLVSSSWSFTRRLGPLNISGAFKIVDGVIYHVDADHPVGAAALDASGRLHLNFQNHRKIPAGEAVVEKAANGEWRGILNFNGDAWRFELSRR